MDRKIGGNSNGQVKREEDRKTYRQIHRYADTQYIHIYKEITVRYR